MHDFDPQQRERQEARDEAFRNRSFQVRGEVFTYRPNVPFEVIRTISLLSENTPGSSIVDTMARTIRDIIENTVDEVEGEEPVSAHERWDRVCSEESDFPITFEDLHEISNWLIAQAVNRPTSPPASSVGGRSTNGSDSTEPSSGEEAEVLTA